MAVRQGRKRFIGTGHSVTGQVKHPGWVCHPTISQNPEAFSEDVISGFYVTDQTVNSGAFQAATR
tara:strand:- start:45 stop:239 length:195 start_codon:yes stop_codon:yes gene_type:complete